MSIQSCVTLQCKDPGNCSLPCHGQTWKHPHLCRDGCGSAWWSGCHGFSPRSQPEHCSRSHCLHKFPEWQKWFHVNAFITRAFMILAQCNFSRTVTKVVYCWRTKKGVSGVSQVLWCLGGYSQQHIHSSICSKFKQHEWIVCVSYLCMVRDVKADIFTVADIAVLYRGARPLTANTDSWTHWKHQSWDPLLEEHPKYWSRLIQVKMIVNSVLCLLMDYKERKKIYPCTCCEWCSGRWWDCS